MSDHHTRHCTSCTAALAADNSAELCGSCAKAVQAAPDVAPVLSADFWEQPEIRSVLLSRNFGRFLRTYRTVQQPQVKQTQLAHWLGITQGQLSRIERSSIPVGDLHKLDTWARVLHVPPDRLWFSPSPAPPDPSEAAPNRATVEKSQHNEGSDVRRRDLLKVAGVAAAAAGTGLLSETPWQRLIDSVDKGRPVDTATVQLMQDRTADLFHTEETVPARQLLESIAQHRNTLTVSTRQCANRLDSKRSRDCNGRDRRLDGLASVRSWQGKRRRQRMALDVEDRQGDGRRCASRVRTRLLELLSHIAKRHGPRSTTVATGEGVRPWLVRACHAFLALCARGRRASALRRRNRSTARR